MLIILLVLVVVLAIEVFILRGRVAKLERFNNELQSVAGQEDKETIPVKPVVQKMGAPLEAHSPEEKRTVELEAVTPPKIRSGQGQMEEDVEITVKEELLELSASDSTRIVSDVVQYFKDFFTTGNVVLKVGIIILFFWVAFLLKYAAQHSLISLELRLAGVGMGVVEILLFGWLLIEKRLLYGLVLQGGGVGVLYLTVFAAAKLYGLVPYNLSFLLMLGLVVLSGVLAVLQDSRSLAAFGACGGFLAPVLMSTGSGSHVMLFSYYAVLNSGIVGIAWFRAWRELNLLGFCLCCVFLLVAAEPGRTRNASGKTTHGGRDAWLPDLSLVQWRNCTSGSPLVRCALQSFFTFRFSCLSICHIHPLGSCCTGRNRMGDPPRQSPGVVCRRSPSG